MTEQNEEPEQKIEYGTKEEAERRYVEKNIRIDSTHCPLKDKPCRRSCVCCEELKVVNVGSEDAPHWECHGGFCTAYMLVGPT